MMYWKSFFLHLPAKAIHLTMAWRLSIKSEIQYRNIFCYWKLRIPPTHERWRRWRSLEAKNEKFMSKRKFFVGEICRWGGWFWVWDWEESWNGAAHSNTSAARCSDTRWRSTMRKKLLLSMAIPSASLRLMWKVFAVFFPPYSSEAVPNLHHFHINYQIICFYQSNCSAWKSHLIMTTIKHSWNTSPGIHNTTLWLGFT